MSQIIGADKSAGADVIKDATIETFEADVLQASMQTPVIVDFWAEWCGPCKQLAPALEKAVKAAGGRVRLVKIDIDKNQMLASQMRIQSVPTVYAFFQGRPVDGFQGALPESEIKAFIERLTALGEGDGPGDIKDHIAAADAAFEKGDVATAAEIYGRIAQADEGNPEALAGLARCHLAMKDIEQARAIVDAIPADKQSSAAVQSVKAALELASGAGAVGDIETLSAKVAGEPDNLEARFELADARIGAGDMEAALDDLLAIIERDRSWNDEAARKKLLTLFDALGGAHPLTVQGRKKLSSILFS